MQHFFEEKIEKLARRDFSRWHDLYICETAFRFCYSLCRSRTVEVNSDIYRLWRVNLYYVGLVRGCLPLFFRLSGSL